jgi:TIR domain
MNAQGPVFLSYASQDAEAAKRICESLQAAGVEVWFDQSELRGGDAWDQNIRQKIQECALFVPVISANTQSRPEGYFRLEWKLAVDRSHLMSDDYPFLVPVVVDGTPDAAARVPARFRERQWTRLPRGETPPDFCARVRKLLSGANTNSVQSQQVSRGSPTVSSQVKASRPWLFPAIVGTLACAALAIWRPWRKGPETVPADSMAAPLQSPAPLSEARQLMQRAGAIWEYPNDASRDKFEAAEGLYAHALTLDPADAEVWAAVARLDARMVFLGYDISEDRRRKAQTEADRAIALAPDSAEARQAQACVFAFAVPSPERLAEAEKLYRVLIAANPENKSLAEEFGIVLRDEHHFDESVALDLKSGLTEEAGWTYYVAGRHVEAAAMADRILAKERKGSALHLKALVEFLGLEDLEAAYAATRQFTSVELLSDGYAKIALLVSLSHHDYDRAIELLEAFPRDDLNEGGWSGLPKRYWLGLAHELAGRPDAARAQWQVALQQVQEGLKANTHDLSLLAGDSLLLACLGENDESKRAYLLYKSFSPRAPEAGSNNNFIEEAIKLQQGRKEEVLAYLSETFRARKDKWEEIHANARFCPWYDPLRGDPRFEMLLRENMPKLAKPFDEPAVKASP